MSILKKTTKVLAALVGILLLLIGGLLGYAAMTMDGKLQFPDTPSPRIAASTDSLIIEQGRYLVHATAHCAQCHSTDDRSRPELTVGTPLSGGLAFEMGPLGTRYAKNLTPDEETGIGRLSDSELARAIRTGVMHSGELSFFMRYSASELSDEDITAIISYLRTLEPVRKQNPEGEWYLVGKALMTYAFPKMLPRPEAGPAHVPADAEPSIERGRYLSDHVMLCSQCHTGFDMKTFLPTGPKLGGSLPDRSHGDDKDMEFVAPNLTSHPTGYTGMVSEDAFVARMKRGRAYKSSIMPWENIGNTTENDLRSVYRYLRSLPPVETDHGPSYRKVGWSKD